jgi:hypothetical protein
VGVLLRARRGGVGATVQRRGSTGTTASPTTPASGIPDAVWNTLSLRDDGDIPPDLVAVYATGDGEQLCVQSGTSDTPMLAICPGSGEEPELVASDFGAWFKEIVEGEIADA